MNLLLLNPSLYHLLFQFANTNLIGCLVSGGTSRHAEYDQPDNLHLLGEAVMRSAGMSLKTVPPVSAPNYISSKLLW